MKVIFSQRAMAAIMAETTEKIQTETGGLFLGKLIEDTWYVVEAIDPGPNSIFEVAYFEYDQPYVQHLINKVAAIYQERLELIGLWHRHPGSFDQFSGTDDQTNNAYASMRPQGAISMLVNLDPDFRMTIYHVEQVYGCYHRISCEVGDDLFPRKLLMYRSIEDCLELIRKKCDHRREKQVKTKSIEAFFSEISSYLDSRPINSIQTEEWSAENDIINRLLTVLYSDLEFLRMQKVSVRVKWERNEIWLLPENDDRTEAVKFGYLTKDELVCIWHGKEFSYQSGDFEKAWKNAHQSSVVESHAITGSIVESNKLEELAKRVITFGRRKGD